jgi:hypothetical protein
MAPKDRFRGLPQYYGRLLRIAFLPSFSAGDIASTAISLLLPFGIWAGVLALTDAQATLLTWAIPLGTSALLFLIRLVLAPFIAYRQDVPLTPVETITPFYRESDPTCREYWTNPRGDDPMTSTWFRLGIVNLGPRIDHVRAYCGTTSPTLQPSLYGTPFYTYPDEIDDFSIPASVGPDRPSLYLNISYAELVDGRRSFVNGVPMPDVWTRYHIGPARRDKGYIAYGKLVDQEAQFAFSVLLEIPHRTIEIPCVLWLEDAALCRFALAADAPPPTSAPTPRDPRAGLPANPSAPQTR